MVAALVAVCCVAFVPAETLGPASRTQTPVTIIKAEYGLLDHPGRFCDVTAALQAVIEDARPRIVVTNDEMGADLAPGEVKTLRIVYDAGDGRKTATVVQHGTLRLHAERSAVHIVGAEYGLLDMPGKVVGVTKRVRETVLDERPRIVATKDELGGVDPAPNVLKQLRVAFEEEGRSRSAVIGENRTLYFPAVKP